MQSTASLYDEIAAVLDEYAVAWTQGALQKVADRWPAGEEQLTYIAEELGEILTDRHRIAQHLLQTQHRLTRSSVILKDLQVRQLDERLALATFICRWDLDWVSYSRVAVILRRKGRRWWFIHYMEAPFHLEDWGAPDLIGSSGSRADEPA